MPVQQVFHKLDAPEFHQLSISFHTPKERHAHFPASREHLSANWSRVNLLLKTRHSTSLSLPRTCNGVPRVVAHKSSARRRPETDAGSYRALVEDRLLS